MSFINLIPFPSNQGYIARIYNVYNIHSIYSVYTEYVHILHRTFILFLFDISHIYPALDLNLIPTAWTVLTTADHKYPTVLVAGERDIVSLDHTGQWQNCVSRYSATFAHSIYLSSFLSFLSSLPFIFLSSLHPSISLTHIFIYLSSPLSPLSLSFTLISIHISLLSLRLSLLFCHLLTLYSPPPHPSHHLNLNPLLPLTHLYINPVPLSTPKQHRVQT